MTGYTSETEEHINLSIEKYNILQSKNGEISAVGSKIRDVDSAIAVIGNLNTKIFETSGAIENSTNQQKLATEESNRITAGVSSYAMNIVEISRPLTNTQKCRPSQD